VSRTDCPSSSANIVEEKAKFTAIVAAAMSARTTMNSRLSLGGSIAWKATAARNAGVAEPARLMSNARQR
jgi:hypothetical protein